MDLIRYAIDRPVAVIAAVLIAVLFGTLALSQIPIQLAPDVRKPIVVVDTSWPGAAPSEIEREIVNPQEETLRGLDGLEIMTSRSRTGQASVTLEFAVGTNMSQSLLLVSNRLDRVGGYPDEASQPTLNTSGSDDSPIAWVLLTAKEGNTRAMPTYGDFLEDVIKDRVERIEGVSAVNVFGGTQRELQIVVDPQRLSRYGLTVPEVVRTLRAENISISAGDVDEGKRRYIVRTESSLNTEEEIRNVVLRSGVATGGIGRVRVMDVAEVAFAYREATSRLRFKGQPGLAFNVVRESGANVISVMEELRVVLDELRAGPLADVGLDAEQVYDETIYIQGAID
ncbi:MAG: HAE1 family hydrophobic/amphiphilic exporter-1, partial [Dinoroseobacter sp.]